MAVLDLQHRGRNQVEDRQRVGQHLPVIIGPRGPKLVEFFGQVGGESPQDFPAIGAKVLLGFGVPQPLDGAEGVIQGIFGVASH